MLFLVNPQGKRKGGKRKRHSVSAYTRKGTTVSSFKRKGGKVSAYRQNADRPHPRSYGAHVPLRGTGYQQGDKFPKSLLKLTKQEKAYEAALAGGASFDEAVASSRALAKQKKWVNPPSAAQIAARKKFAEMARAGAFRSGTKRIRRKARGDSESSSTRRLSGESMARKKSKSRRGVTRRKSVVGVRRRRKSVRRSNPMGVRRRRKSVRRRNPMGISSAKGVMGQVSQAAIQAGVILIGKALTNRVSAMIPLGATGGAAVNAAKQIAVGLGLSMIAKRVAPKHANAILVGALLAPMESLLANVPIIGPSLSPASAGTGTYLPWAGGMGSYIAWPQGNGGLGADVKDHSRLGEYDYDESGTGAY